MKNRFRKPASLVLIFFLVFISSLFVGIGPNKVWSNVQQLYNKWMILTMILEKIERFYVDEKHPDELLKDAIDGMLFGLDPHSIYLTPDQYKDYSRKYDGYFGFGLKYCRIDSLLAVTALVPGGPAQAAGIRIGDRIVKIAGVNVAGIESGAIDQFMSGQRDKVLEMVIQRPGQPNRQTLELAKEQILDDTIPVVFMLEAGTGYVKISYFSDSTPQELDAALTLLRTGGMQRLLLDLRDNSGGTFSSGVAVADRFLSAGKMIVFTKGRAPQSSEQFVATNTNTASDIPLVVLVNEATASDAEIVAGAVQDWDRGLIVGRRTYGKALVQTEFAFQDESVLLLTTARYYTPLGRLIQKSYHEADRQNNDKKKSEPQKYKTPSGRIVYGGGGIQPDFALKSVEKNIPQPLRRLYSVEENILWKFADWYVSSLPGQAYSGQMEDFLASFTIDAGLWQQFKVFLQNEKVALSPAEMAANEIFLKAELKTEIAGRLWGDTGRYAAVTKQDAEVKESLKYFDQAKSLLEK